MTDGDCAVRCPKCHSIPDNRTDLPTETELPFIRVLMECHCGHSWKVKRFKEDGE